MTGTLINVFTVLLGGSLGLFLGGRLPERLKSTVIAGLGLFTTALGLQMFFKSENALIVLGGLLIGSLLGEWWHIEEGLRNLGTFLEARFARDSSSHFVRGFLTTSLLFCIGPMTILGAIQDGLTGDYRLLAVKAVMDGFAALAFASSLGLGVAFLCAHRADLPRNHQPARRPIEHAAHPGHDERDDRYRWRDPTRTGDQQPAGDQTDPHRQFSACPSDQPPDRMDFRILEIGKRPARRPWPNTVKSTRRPA